VLRVGRHVGEKHVADAAAEVLEVLPRGVARKARDKHARLGPAAAVAVLVRQAVARVARVLRQLALAAAAEEVAVVHVAHGVRRVAVVLVGHEGEAELEVDAAAHDAACGRGGGGGMRAR
jgi:hypothetical protein